MTEPLMWLCPSCGAYSLRAACPKCGSATRSPHPARFSPQDRWARYRRALFAEAAKSAAAGSR